MVVGQSCGDNARGGFDPVVARGDAAEVGEGCHDANGSVETPLKVGDVVEENDSGDAGGVGGVAEAGAHHGIESARLVDQGGPNPVSFLGQKITGNQRALGKGDACDDSSGGFAAGMGVDDLHRDIGIMAEILDLSCPEKE